MTPIRILLCAAIITSAAGSAQAQLALDGQYGFKLAAAGERATYFLSGIKRGAEPDSIEAWVWTLAPATAGEGASTYDAKAQRSVMRCTGKSIEELETEYYLEGRFVRSTEAPMRIPADVKPGSEMQAVWQVACDTAVRYSVKTIPDLEHVYAEVRRPTP